MFCPMCKSEYRKGFTTCEKCGARLVDELPSERPPEFVDYDEILSTFNPADIAVIKSILHATDIVYFFHGEHFGYMRPFGLPTRLMVKKDQVRQAKEILKDLKLSFCGINLPKGRKKDDDEGSP